MKFSKESIEVLMDLVEIKISNLVIQDKEDNRELRKLRQCRDELRKLISAHEKQTQSVSQKCG